jgi:hypothetical protein
MYCNVQHKNYPENNGTVSTPRLNLANENVRPSEATIKAET